MANEEMLKKAVEAFKALTPEQQAEMLEEQRQSWVRGNVGLSRDERGITTPVMPRPAAQVEGLETVTYRAKFKSEMAMQWQYYPAPDSGFDPDKYEEQALCLQSQAEAIIAAKDAEWQAAAKLGSEVNRNLANRVNALQADNATLKAGIKRLSDEQELLAETGDDDMISVVKLAARLSEAEADNAALTARVKELETSLTVSRATVRRGNAWIKAIETQLAAAEKVREAAIELDEAISDDFNIFGAQQKLRAALGGKP